MAVRRIIEKMLVDRVTTLEIPLNTRILGVVLREERPTLILHVTEVEDQIMEKRAFEVFETHDVVENDYHLVYYGSTWSEDYGSSHIFERQRPLVTAS